MKQNWFTRHKKLLIILGLIIVNLIIIWRILFLFTFNPPRPYEFGVSFSPAHASYIGLDWQSAYLATLDDLKVKYLRLGTYWNQIERQHGTYDFSQIDWLMDQAAARGTKVMLVVGRRQPRWPECHIPSWAQNLTEDGLQTSLEQLIAQTVERYRHHPALEYWQVENEPFLKLFGICPNIARKKIKENLKQEVALVKQLDSSHPTIVTDSGELGSWLRVSYIADLFGTTTYRVVHQPFIGYVRHNLTIPAAFYRIKAWLVGRRADEIILVEMQAEPWPPGDIINTSIDEQFKSMDIFQFQKNLNFAQKMGFPRVYLWGAEWWYWMKLRGYPEFWTTSQQVL